MLPFKKIFASKSVCLVLIFLSSTTFGFLESDFRDDTSKKSVRGSRDDSFNKEFLEDLPFRRDISRQANEKDRVYENIYDRRSFRTGTDRLTRIDDKERFRHTCERNSEGRDSSERSVRLHRDAKDTKSPSNNRERFIRERSKTFQNSRIDIRSSQISRENKKPIMSQNSRAWQIREPLTNRVSSERSLENQETVSDQRVRQIRNLVARDNMLRKISINNRSYREGMFENIEHLASYNTNKARQSRAQTSTDSRIRNIEHQRVRTYNIENRERTPARGFSKVSRESRNQDIRQLIERSLKSQRSFRNTRHFRQSPERENILVQDARARARLLSNQRYATDNRYNIISEFRHNSEQPLVSRYQNEKERLPSLRYTRDIRQYPQLSLENRYRKDFRDAERSIINRERSAENLIRFARNLHDNEIRKARSIGNRERRTNQIEDVGLREQNMYNRERRLNIRERSMDTRELNIDMDEQRMDMRERKMDTRERRMGTRERNIEMRERSMDTLERNIDMRERSTATRKRSIDTSRSLENNDLQENKIRNRQFGERDNINQRITMERYSRTTPDNILESRRVSTFSTKNERESIENRTIRAVKIRTSERAISRKALSRATLSRSDSARQIRDARINLQESEIRQMSSNSQKRDEVRTLRSTSADRNSKELRMIPIVEYTPLNRRSFERIDETRNMKVMEKSLKLEAFANVVQVILGVYLIGQMFAHSSKKTLFGFERILPSMVFAKQKME